MMEEALRQRIAWLHEHAAGSIGDRFGFEVLECGEDWCLFRCRTEGWMRNAFGTLHGGISGAIADQAMGYLTACLLPGEGMAPTVQMQTVYHHPLPAEGTILARTRVTAQTRTFLHLACELLPEAGPDTVCVSTTGIYYFIPAKR